MKLQFRSLGIAALWSAAFLHAAPAQPAEGPLGRPEAARLKPMILALKYVSYREPGGSPVLQEAETRALVSAVNAIYSRCSIEFRLEQFQTAVPRESGLVYQPSRMVELDPIRSRFEDPTRLVVITTGPWNRDGGLGKDGANAWTMMPGDRPAGTVLEGTFARNANLLAHELGHYLNLDHRHERDNLMNPVIYRDSTGIDPLQCERMRTAALAWRSEAIRNATPEAPTLVQTGSGAVRAGQAPQAELRARSPR